MEQEKIKEGKASSTPQDEKLEAIKQRCAEILAYYDLPELPEWFDEDPYSVAKSIMQIINDDTEKGGAE